MTLEGPTECSFRTVPESTSCLTCAHALLTNPAPGEGYPPPCHVLYRRHPYQSGESLSKDGSRQVDLPRQGSNRPGFLEPGHPQLSIAQQCEPLFSPGKRVLSVATDG